MYQRPCILQEKIDDTKWIIRSRKSKKNEYYNCQKKKDIGTQGHTMVDKTLQKTSVMNHT